MTLLFIFAMFLVYLSLVYFDYMLGVVRVIIMFMQWIAKCSFLLTNGVSGRHCVSVVLIHCLPTETPYILGHVVDHGCDTLVESFLVHSPNIGTHRVRLRRKNKLYS